MKALEIVLCLCLIGAVPQLAACHRVAGSQSREAFRPAHVVDLTHTLGPAFPYIPVPGVTFPFSLAPIASLEKHDDIAEMRHYDVTPIAGRKAAADDAVAVSVPTLFEWAGGLTAFERLTRVFYERVKDDAVLAPVFASMSAEHARYVALFLAEVFGGPSSYSEARGGHRAMVSRHLGRRLTPIQRRRWVELLLDCADESGLPDDPEFRSAFVAYPEWGSRLALLNSQDDAVSELDQPMLKWGWGETGGPYQA
jgi:hemoglobin